MADRYIRFTGVIAGITRDIRRITAEAISRFGIKRSFVPCIYFLQKHGPLSATKLCKLCDEDKANISRTLKALEDEGYVVKEVRTSPRARVKMRLSESGAEIGSYISKCVSDMVTLATEGISDGEIETMYSVLERIGANLRGVLEEIDQ
ncbi:MAG: winged helix-turn-helix transcriptional regulator [Clostridia bacterium]|nr:winged helix-turn-helix transcriptional regulator [Clostridia bacterium]